MSYRDPVRSASPFRSRKTALLLGPCLVALLAGHASASVVRDTTPVDFSGGFVQFGYGNKDFTFTDNGDFFSSDSVTTTGGGAVSSLGAPFYNPPQPSTYFDPVRGSGVLEFGPTSFVSFSSFATETVIPYSGTPFFIGLADTTSDGTHYGYGEFNGTTLVSYAFESVAGRSILTPVPLPASAPMFGAALLAMGVVRYGMNRKTKAAF